MKSSQDKKEFKMSNKDLHVSYRINQEMLQYHEELMDKICELVGRKVPQSRIMRAIMAVMRDEETLRKQMIKKVAEYLKQSLKHW